jgi:hypothetical protein
LQRPAAAHLGWPRGRAAERGLGRVHNVEMTRSLVPDLKRVARIEQQLAMYIGIGNTAW